MSQFKSICKMVIQIKLYHAVMRSFARKSRSCKFHFIQWVVKMLKCFVIKVKLSLVRSFERVADVMSKTTDQSKFLERSCCNQRQANRWMLIDGPSLAMLNGLTRPSSRIINIVLVKYIPTY